jgi:hypothetical protein
MNKKSEGEQISNCPLQWETRKVKVKDLVQLDINPRKISDAMKKKLAESLSKFNLVEIPAVNTDMRILGGNQRVAALLMAERGDEEIDVRYPNRKLTEKEVKEYAIISNTHAGEFDFEMLADWDFDFETLADWGVDMEVTRDILNKNEIGDDEFEKEIKKYDDTNCELAITPSFHEKYSYFIILCENEIDESFIRNTFELTKKQTSHKLTDNRLSNILTVEKLQEIWLKLK